MQADLGQARDGDSDAASRLQLTLLQVQQSALACMEAVPEAPGKENGGPPPPDVEGE